MEYKDFTDDIGTAAATIIPSATETITNLSPQTHEIMNNSTPCRLDDKTIEALIRLRELLKIKSPSFNLGNITDLLGGVSKELFGDLALAVGNMFLIVEQLNQLSLASLQLLKNLSDKITKGLKLSQHEIEQYLSLLSTRPMNSLHSYIMYMDLLDKIVQSIRSCKQGISTSIQDIGGSAMGVNYLKNRQATEKMLQASGINNPEDVLGANANIPNMPLRTSAITNYLVEPET